MIKRFFSQAWLNFKSGNSAFNFEMFIVLQIAIPLFGLLSTCVIAGYSFNTTNLTWWVVGSSFVSCTHGIIFTLGSSFSTDRYMGTLRSIIVSPSKKIGVILQKGFFPVLVSIVTLIAHLTVGSLIFSISYSGVNFGYLLIVIFFSMCAAIGFTIFLSIFALLFDSLHLILNTIAVVMGVLCGASFPITQLPQAVQFISYLLPLTRSVQAANMLFTGIDSARFIQLIIGELLVGIVYFVLAAIIIKLIERISIKKATFDTF